MFHNHEYTTITLPKTLAVELDKIDWTKVSKVDLLLLKSFGLPFLKQRGCLKDEKKKES